MPRPTLTARLSGLPTRLKSNGNSVPSSHSASRTNSPSRTNMADNKNGYHLMLKVTVLKVRKLSEGGGVRTGQLG